MSLTTIVDKVFYEMHRIPAATLHAVANITKYGTAKLETLIGCGSLVTYLASTGMLLNSAHAENLSLFDKSVTLGGAGLLGIMYAWQFYKNYKETRVAQAREKGLDNQLLGSVVKYEEKLQRYRQKGAALWYAAALPVWALFLGVYSYLGGMDLNDPNLITMVVSATVSTNCLYGARYVLTTEYSYKRSKRKVLTTNGDEKHAI